MRAEGSSYPEIAAEVGIKYSTVHSICLNRAYLGEVKYSGNWYRGVHAPLVNERQFNAARRGHTKGQRRSKDLLSGKVRCGICMRVAGVHYNDRNQSSVFSQSVILLLVGNGAGTRRSGTPSESGGDDSTSPTSAALRQCRDSLNRQTPTRIVQKCCRRTTKQPRKNIGISRNAVASVVVEQAKHGVVTIVIRL